jgi:Short C-terminal domain
MNKFALFLIVSLFAAGIAMAQDSGMKGMMKQDQPDGMGMMGMMNMMEQCSAMMKEKSANQETALDILKKRYARGEISRQEFEAMKKDVQ